MKIKDTLNNIFGTRSTEPAPGGAQGVISR